MTKNDGGMVKITADGFCCVEVLKGVLFMANNGTMMQYFEWYLAPLMLWRQMGEHAEQLKEDGISALWIPPAYKGAGGIQDVGYGTYDLYDLGEFDQKGTIPTKYGTKEELVQGIRTLHEHGIQVYADIVLDHKMGADEVELVDAREVNPNNRNETEGESRKIEAWTHFCFPGRKKIYSDFEWHWYHFTGIDHDAENNEDGVFRFQGKKWSDVDKEKGNFDYLMGADIDLNNEEVDHELMRWGKWFVHLTDVDGFRFDAVKHMKFTFYSEWLDTLRREEKEELFSVGEYWTGDVETLKHYVDTTEGTFSLFDVPLHFRLYDASKSGSSFDMRTIFNETFTADNPMKSVTFVDNHDTQPGQMLESWVEDWFRPLAYALILLRQDGYPCVFYGDYYGIPHDNIPPMRDKLLPLLYARTHCAYGKQNEYFDHPNTIGWTREGDKEHESSGLAVLMTNGAAGSKTMYVGTQFAGAHFFDCTGNRKETIVIGNDGSAEFFVNDGAVSVWIKKPGAAYTNLQVLEGDFSFCKLQDISGVRMEEEPVFLGKTEDEISLVCRTAVVPGNCIQREDGWRLFRVVGTIDFSVTGLLSRIATILAENEISVSAISTYNTDYLMVKEEKLQQAILVLMEAGYTF